MEKELTLEESTAISVGDLVDYDDGSYYGRNKVTAIDEVYNLDPNEAEALGLSSTTLWFYPETGEVVGYHDSADNEWGFLKLDKTLLEKSTLVNRFFWIEDFDGGHSLPYYEVYPSNGA